MYTLHYAPDNASLVVRLALEELGLTYRTELVDRSIRQQKSAAFLRLNPAGLIPVLETPQGPLSETAAILLWLTETHGAPPSGRPLAPPPGDPARGPVLKWLFWLSNSLHADLRIVFYPQQYVGPDIDAMEALHAGVTRRLAGHYTLLEALVGQPWFGGADPTILDLYAAVTMRWAALYAPMGAWFTAADYPGLKALAQRLETRPSVQAAIRAEGLGATPFSAPKPCQPPEGTAL